MAAEADRLSQALHTVADEARPVYLPADLWARRRRRRRRSVAILCAAALILVAAVALPGILARGLPWTAPPPAQPRPAVPATVHAPLPWQPTAQDAPPGPASMVVTGHGPFASSDAFDGYEDDAMVVATSGYSRMVKYNSDVQSMMLSPDGRFLAGDGMEGSSPSATWPTTAVLDLTTGRVRTYEGRRLMAWSPDGRVLTIVDGPADEVGLWLLDPGTGQAARVFRPPNTVADRYAVAFSPDSRQFVVLSFGTLYLVDVATASGRKLADVPGRAFGGIGAWTPGGLVTLWQRTACPGDCPYNVFGTQASTFQATYVDASTGAPAVGPQLDELVGHGARLLGWMPDGSAVVRLVHDAVPPGELSASELLALHPGGGHRTLVDLPAGAANVDVARDLIRAGAFEGPSPSTVARIADVIDSHTVALLVICSLALAVIPGLRLRRTLRLRRMRAARARPWKGDEDSW